MLWITRLTLPVNKPNCRVAHRGHPFLDDACLDRTGGHRGPPLQLFTSIRFRGEVRMPRKLLLLILAVSLTTSASVTSRAQDVKEPAPSTTATKAKKGTKFY